MPSDGEFTLINDLGLTKGFGFSDSRGWCEQGASWVSLEPAYPNILADAGFSAGEIAAIQQYVLVTETGELTTDARKPQYCATGTNIARVSRSFPTLLELIDRAGSMDFAFPSSRRPDFSKIVDPKDYGFTRTSPGADGFFIWLILQIVPTRTGRRPKFPVRARFSVPVCNSEDFYSFEEKYNAAGDMVEVEISVDCNETASYSFRGKADASGKWDIDRCSYYAFDDD